MGVAVEFRGSWFLPLGISEKVRSLDIRGKCNSDSYDSNKFGSSGS